MKTNVVEKSNTKNTGVYFDYSKFSRLQNKCYVLVTVTRKFKLKESSCQVFHPLRFYCRFSIANLREA